MPTKKPRKTAKPTKVAKRTKAKAKPKPKRAASRERASETWEDVARNALGVAIGDHDAIVLIDSLAGEPPRVVVSLAIAAPPDLVPVLRSHPLFDAIVAAIRTALASALPGTEIVQRLVPVAIDTSREMLSLALDVAKRGDLADALSLPPSPERDRPHDAEKGRSFEVTRLRIEQIQATALRKIAVLTGTALPPEGEVLEGGHVDAAPAGLPARELPHEDGGDRTLDWFPARTLMNETAKPRFWLIARLGRTVSVRQAQRMRGLSETRREHRDEAVAQAELESRIAAKLAAGWTLIFEDDIATMLVHHEPLIPEMPRDVQRRAAAALLARREWTTSIAAQALVRVLGASDDSGDVDLARALVARIQKLDA